MNTINFELSKLTEWFQANRLSINFKKSNLMIFKPRQMRKTYDLSITLSNHSIDRVNETVFLGVIIGENLSWKQHIANVARKVSKSLGIIFKSSFYFPKSSLITLYYTLIYPHRFYCVNIWGSTYITNLQRIVILQKRSIRIIYKSSFDTHTF